MARHVLRNALVLWLSGQHLNRPCKSGEATGKQKWPTLRNVGICYSGTQNAHAWPRVETPLSARICLLINLGFVNRMHAYFRELIPAWSQMEWSMAERTRWSGQMPDRTSDHRACTSYYNGMIPHHGLICWLHQHTHEGIGLQCKFATMLKELTQNKNMCRSCPRRHSQLQSPGMGRRI
jgi:hypothetical protein